VESLRNLLVIGEKETFRKIAEIIELAGKANAIVSKMLSSDAIDEFVASNEEIHKLEKQSDELAFKLKEDILDGAINPNVIDNLLDSVELADTLLDTYYYISRELKRMARSAYKNESFELDEAFTRVSELSDHGLAILAKLLSTSDVSEASDLRGEIESLEEEGDDLKDDAFDKLYEAAPNLHYLQFNHFAELLHKMDVILDSCQDLADAIIEIQKSLSQ
jgi:uncharacterized protein Yka (UPF0111/DUF47 family)